MLFSLCKTHQRPAEQHRFEQYYRPNRRLNVAVSDCNLIPNLIKVLESEKIGVTADQTIKEIAEQHQIAPQELYGLIRRLADAQ